MIFTTAYGRSNIDIRGILVALLAADFRYGAFSGGSRSNIRCPYLEAIHRIVLMVEEWSYL